MSQLWIECYNVFRSVWLNKYARAVGGPGEFLNRCVVDAGSDKLDYLTTCTKGVSFNSARTWSYFVRLGNIMWVFEQERGQRRAWCVS
jgi:hypothetical protein